jgi:hypothetical protein
MSPISPLQLRDYFIESLHVDANTDFVAKEGRGFKSKLQIDFDFLKRDDAPTFRIDLDVRVNSTEESFNNAAYGIRIKTQTFLEFDPSTPDSEIKKMIGPNGLAMAYAIARGIVGQATGTSLHGKFLLPTVNFVELIRAKAKSLSRHASPRATSKSNNKKHSRNRFRLRERLLTKV